MIYKNTASQKIGVRAWNQTTGEPVTGDAANITAQISINGGTAAATNDTNPTEIDATDHPGLYVFDMTQAEVNGNLISLTPVSATANIVLDPIDFHTLPEVFPLMYEAAIVAGAISDGAPTTTSFDTTLTETTVDHYKDLYVVWVTGPNTGSSQKVSAYDGAGVLTLNTATVETPTNNDIFLVLGRSE